MFATNLRGKGLKGMVCVGEGRALAIADVKENLLLMKVEAMMTVFSNVC